MTLGAKLRGRAVIAHQDRPPYRLPMHRLLLAATLLLAACGFSPGDSSSSDTGTMACSEAGCVCVDGSCDEGLLCASQICVPSPEASSSGTSSGGGLSSSSSSDGSTSAGALTSDDTSGSETSASTSTSTSSGSTSAEPVCGDGALDDGEACDDGNIEPGDGCSPACSVERWEHEGVALGVPVADLVGWKQCWSGTYGAGDTVGSLISACQGDHLMMACRVVGSEYLTVAAHAPRADVMFPVDYGAGERHEANGVAWYWSPTSNIEGFAPGGTSEGCEANTNGIQSGYLCWVNNDDDPLTFQVGRRCGSSVINAKEAQATERLMFQSWD